MKSKKTILLPSHKIERLSFCENRSAEQVLSDKYLGLTIDQVIMTLPPRYAYIIRAKFGLNETGETKTHAVISKEFNVSVTQVGHMFHRAICLLRHSSRSKRLKIYA